MERELLLLGLLRRHDMHGYQLAEFIERDLNSCTNLKKSTAYFLLDKMAQQGWVTPYEAQEGNRPQRRIYHITALGETQFQRLLRQNLATYYEPTFTGDVGLAFLDALPPAEVVALLRERLDRLAEQRARYVTIPTHVGPSQLLIDHQVRHLESEIDWVASVISLLDQPS